jgi:hypothetical protein
MAALLTMRVGLAIGTVSLAGPRRAAAVLVAALRTAVLVVAAAGQPPWMLIPWHFGMRE